MFSSNTTQVSDGGYQISRSLRFNSADSAYLNRTPASDGNQLAWTISLWVKRSKNGAEEHFVDSTGFQFYFDASDVIGFIEGGTNLQTSQVFRDNSAWYHVVAVWDSANATSTDRARLYINGSRVTAFSSATYPVQNRASNMNRALATYIGKYYNASSGYMDGYMTEVNFIDGQQLTPSSFGETNAQTGVWSPIAYSGSYGTNGFYLNFSDNSNTTAATLGKDYSGNGNNWTPNNFSVTAGAGNDSLVDNPTQYGFDTGVGGSVRGNYCTLNPLFVPLAGVNYFALSNGNLDITGTATANSGDSIGTISTGISGKYYFEVNITSIDATGYGIVGASDINQLATATTYNYLGFLTKSYGYRSSGVKDNNNLSTSYGSSYTTGDVIGVAIDCDNGAIYFSKNNTWQNSGVPTSGSSRTGAAFTWTGGSQDMVPQMAVYKTGTTLSDNFGQRVFSYTAPSGFKALCTQNLPTPTIGATTATQAGKFFNPVLYTGNGGTQSVTGVGFQPDLVWVKSRSNAYWHTLVDSVRGRAYILSSNVTNADIGPEPSDKELTAFTSDGFSLGPDYNVSINSSGATFVSWNWKANGSGSTNTSGSITSTVSANTTSGFSVVTWTAPASTGTHTVGHGLGVAPSMIIAKSRSGGTGGLGWSVYFTTLGNSAGLALNTTAASFSSANYWGSSNPTSTVFSLNDAASASGYDNNTGNMVAYCFAPIAGYSAFSSYTGNGSADGPFIFTGMRPAYLVLKSSAGVVQTWIVEDSKMFPYNVVSGELYPNDAGAQSTGQTRLDFVSNGFKIRTTDTAFNQSGCTYIYMAFAENPFKYSLAR
jgi:hypothetical protein